jgi:hypothetical protein
MQQRPVNPDPRRNLENRNPAYNNSNSSIVTPQRPSRTFNEAGNRNDNTRPGNISRNQPFQGSAKNGYNTRDGYTSRERYNAARNRRYNSGNTSVYYGSKAYSSRPTTRYYSNPYRYSYSYPTYGQRYNRLNFNYNVIPFGGIGYYYNSGVFYRPYGNYYQVVAPPPGISINMLPFGYSRVVYGADPYYFYGNTYYRQYNNSYQVVEPPIGAKLPALPRGAKSVTIEDERYYEDNGTYYLEELNEKNERLYTVVGVNGVLNTEQANRILNSSINHNIAPANSEFVYSALPANSKKVTINGQEFYRSPDDIYYQEITDGNKVSYQVVGN